MLMLWLAVAQRYVIEFPLVQNQQQQQMIQSSHWVCVRLACSAVAYQIGHSRYKQVHHLKITIVFFFFSHKLQNSLYRRNKNQNTVWFHQMWIVSNNLTKRRWLQMSEVSQTTLNVFLLFQGLSMNMSLYDCHCMQKYWQKCVRLCAQRYSA